MRLFSKIVRVSIVLIVMASYGTTIWLGVTEEHRRSLNIIEPQTEADSVDVEISITSIDTTRGLLTERIRLVPMGRFAMDKNTPATELKVLLNSVSGQQAVTFPKGVRIVPFSAATVLSGNPNEYPFDVYRGNIDLLVTTPARQVAETIVPEDAFGSPLPAEGSSLVIGRSDLNNNETIPIFETVAASIPQFQFKGAVTRDGKHQLTHTHISTRRANNVIAVSVEVMATMIILAISIMAMVLRVTASPGEINLLPLSLCVALIFGLPALRATQPGVPGVGVLGDYVSFMWSMFIVSASAVALAWTWILRSKMLDKAAASSQEKSR